MDSVPIKDITSHEADAHSAQWIQVKGKERPWALSSLGRKVQTGRELTLVALDQRVSPPQLRAVIPDGCFGSDIARTFRDHAVLRLTGTVDCASGRFSVRDIQTADSVSGQAIAIAPFTSKGDRTYVIATASLATVCDRDRTTL